MYDVSILRLGADFGYMFLPGNSRPRVDVRSTAVPNLLHQTDPIAAVLQTKARIESLVKVGAQYEVCILSAIGCGSYGQKPEAIREIYRKAIQEHGKGGRFLFVIRPPRKPKGPGESNYEIFSTLRSGPGSGSARVPATLAMKLTVKRRGPWRTSLRHCLWTKARRESCPYSTTD